MRKLLFRISRLKIMGAFVGFMFAYFPLLIPVKKVIQNKRAISFYHPVASYSEHILIIPRKIRRTVFHLSADDFLSVINMAIHIRQTTTGNYSLLINGGNRQDVMQAHFHLFTGNVADKKGLCKKNGVALSHDKVFWEQIILDLKSSLSQNNLSDENFSILIQFENNGEPLIYYV
jgi:diadenosine tetraphosphate (Ap4A) HIT family hydrolase